MILTISSDLTKFEKIQETEPKIQKIDELGEIVDFGFKFYYFEENSFEKMLNDAIVSDKFKNS